MKFQNTEYDIAYKKIAKKYGIDVELVPNIIMEGLSKEWKMPFH